MRSLHWLSPLGALFPIIRQASLYRVSPWPSQSAVYVGRLKRTYRALDYRTRFPIQEPYSKRGVLRGALWQSRRLGQGSSPSTFRSGRPKKRSASTSPVTGGCLKRGANLSVRAPGHAEAQALDSYHHRYSHRNRPVTLQ